MDQDNMLEVPKVTYCNKIQLLHARCPKISWYHHMGQPRCNPGRTFYSPNQHTGREGPMGCKVLCAWFNAISICFMDRTHPLVCSCFRDTRTFIDTAKKENTRLALLYGVFALWMDFQHLKTHFCHQNSCSQQSLMVACRVTQLSSTIPAQSLSASSGPPWAQSFEHALW